MFALTENILVLEKKAIIYNGTRNPFYKPRPQYKTLWNPEPPPTLSDLRNVAILTTTVRSEHVVPGLCCDFLRSAGLDTCTRYLSDLVCFSYLEGGGYCLTWSFNLTNY